MSKKRVSRLLIMILIVLLFSFFLLKLLHEIKIDGCFDAGGIWDKEDQECIGAKEYYYD